MVAITRKNKNSLILTLITVVLTLLVCYFIAYGLTMYKFKLQGFLFFLVIATMCIQTDLQCKFACITEYQHRP